MNEYLIEGLTVEFYSNVYGEVVPGVVTKVIVDGEGWTDLLVATRGGKRSNPLELEKVVYSDVTIPKDYDNNRFIHFLVR